MIPLLVEEKILEGERLEPEDAVELLERAGIDELAELVALAPKQEPQTPKSNAVKPVPPDLAEQLRSFAEGNLLTDLPERLPELVQLYRRIHAIGASTTATIFYGYGESAVQFVEQISVLRDLQDQTGGFSAFKLRLCSKLDTLQVRQIETVARLFFDNLADGSEVDSQQAGDCVSKEIGDR
jgi:2-iminoacetate synthase ThiH